MTYWIRWQGAGGTEGPPIGEYATRDEAEVARLNQVRAAAAAMEHGTGTAGVWTSDGRLFRDDYDIELGRYVIEQVASEEPEAPDR